MESNTGSEGFRWRCPKCGILLGIIQGTTLSIRYKGLGYRVNVTGLAQIEGLCRNCSIWTETALPVR